MAKQIVNYEEFLEWMRLHKIRRVDLADSASGRGAPISASTVGRYISSGQAMPGDVILAWRKAYQWTDQETMHLLLNGDPPEVESEERQSSAEAALAAIANALSPYM